ncbi:CgeB family protein [Parapedobacter tibetensis]|uniref:CgeB family protein n=1 Tax=Parapedobacter tibetensis TaxID=2972951 RepID=UPI00214DE06F|nr:glycosyltransferase [Parapedobacter tibetensis]
MAKILYIGNNDVHTTSHHRATALVRLGHEVVVHDPYKSVATVLASKYLSPFHYRTGYRFLQSKISNWIRQIIDGVDGMDTIWVNSGELLGPECIKILKTLGCPIILYNNDDPTGKRDGRRFNSLLKALPYYNLCVVRLEKAENELRKHGAGDILRLHMSYDEIAHKPFNSPEDIPAEFKSEVAFIGTWMRNEKRDEFLLKLVSAGLPVSIWGTRWSKSPLWNVLKAYHRGGSLGGRDYVAAMQGAKICIGMLSHGNRDLHTRRSVETTYAGGLLCAQRTSVHLNMYKENEEAVFWNDEEECIEVCRKILSDDQQRERIRKAGNEKVKQLKVGNEDICAAILNRLKS